MRKLKELLEPIESGVSEQIVPAARTGYRIKPLTIESLPELMSLSVRCFRGSETYNRETFEYLLKEPTAVAYKALTDSGQIAGFVFILTNKGSIAHVTTIAVAPEHRKRGLAKDLFDYAEEALAAKGFDSIVLEVRVSNFAAQNLYSDRGFVIIQTLLGYYTDGEDAYLMSKALIR